MKKYQHIYFDLDRTLWDFERNSIMAFKEIFKKYNLYRLFPDFDLFVEVYKRHNESLWDLYREGKIRKLKLRTERFLLTIKELGVDDADLAQKIGDEYVTISPQQTVLFPNTHEILTYLKEKKYKLYIITNGFKEVQYVKMDNSDLTKYFDKVFTSEEVGCQKPKPEIFSHAITSVNAKKSESIMIGDDFNVDIMGAKNYGIDQIFFNPNEHKFDILPSFEVVNLIEIKNIFIRMLDLAVGVDIGGTNTVIGIVDKKGKIFARASFKTSTCKTIEVFTDTLKESLNNCINDIKDPYSLLGIGIGAPNGNFYTGTIEYAPNLPWDGKVEIVNKIEEKCDLPVYLTNDANAAAMGEMTFGGAKGMDNFAVITLGTGLGSGLVVNGSLVFGSDGLAGEMGHVIVERNGRLCGCGRKGCLETYASATAIVRTVNELLAYGDTDSSLLKLDTITAKDIYLAAKDKDEIALKAFQITGEYLGEALANLVAINGPQAIFLFGGLALSGDYILKPTLENMEKNLLEVYKGKVKLMISSISEYDAAILGAASLVWDSME